MMRIGKFAASLIVLSFLAGIGVGTLGSDLLAWRMKALGRKIVGDLKELHWSEVFEMTMPPDRYGLGAYFKYGKSLDSAITNPYSGEADVREGERLFAAHCTACHGVGGGGAAAPSLRRIHYNHGDSSFAIYRVLRDGVPQTAMVAPPLSASERWQVVSYLRSIQQSRAAAFGPKPLPRVNVPVERLHAAGTLPDEWITYSGNLKGWRYSLMREINAENVGKLRPVWKRQFPSELPGQASTPLYVDGRIFVSESPSNVVAVDARTGNFLWRYVHALPRDLPVCCGPVNRGVAVSGGLVFVETLDAQLVALDAATGKVKWKARVADPKENYASTVAPLAIRDLVIVGVSGGEFGVRGFIAAFEASTGRKRWQFNTIPAPGEPGHETWGGGDAWRTGGGPTWVTGSYDAELDLLYWGVGNPSPEFQGAVRPGDNLYTNSVVALRGSTGELVWHFQFTPHDEHDWDSAQTPILTNLDIDGVRRKVICWANRNGYYYVLDREKGKFIRGMPFVPINWSRGLDASGRPILNDTGEQSVSGRRTFPGVGGATNWYPPAYDPARQLVFVQSNDQSTIFSKTPAEKLEYRRGQFYLGSGAATVDEPNFAVRALRASTGEVVWTYQESPLTEANGVAGLLSTAGGLVFGAAGGNLFALDAATGMERWKQPLGDNTQAPPITFSLDGRQVVLVWSGRTLNLFAL